MNLGNQPAPDAPQQSIYIMNQRLEKITKAKQSLDFALKDLAEVNRDMGQNGDEFGAMISYELLAQAAELAKRFGRFAGAANLELASVGKGEA